MTSKHDKREDRTRRDFLKDAGRIAGAAAGVGVLGLAAYDRDPVRKEPEIIHAFPDFKTDAAGMAIARGENAELMVRAAVDGLGGMGRFVAKGETVLIKPNVGWDRQPEQAANTNPEVVGAVAQLCREAGAGQVWVTDVSINDPVRSFTRSGIADAARAAGAEVLYPAGDDFVQARFDGEMLGVWPACRFFIEADRLINVPIVKHHTLSACTLGMKNLYGALGGRRNQLHQSVHVSIADMAAAIRPTLTVLDAVRVLKSNGPTGGSMDDVAPGRTVAVGTDPVALDAFALDFLNLEPNDVPHLGMGAARGLGVVDWRSLSPKEFQVG